MMSRGAHAAAAANAGAQQTCSGSLTARDACRKGIDLVNFVAPQFGAALAGGNAPLAQSGSLGEARLNSPSPIRQTEVFGSIPKIDGQGFNTAGETQSQLYVARSQLIPALSVDGRLWPVSRHSGRKLTHIGGIDLLLSTRLT